MPKLRFIKAWGPCKPGDIKLDASQTTTHFLVDVYKVAVIVAGEAAPITKPKAPTSSPVADTPEPERDLYKYIRKPQQHKMISGAPKAKKITED